MFILIVGIGRVGSTLARTMLAEGHEIGSHTFSHAEVAGLPRRIVVSVPLLTPKLSSLWVGLVTPLPSGLARPLVESLVNEVVVGEHPASAVIDEGASRAVRRHPHQVT